MRIVINIIFSSVNLPSSNHFTSLRLADNRLNSTSRGLPIGPCRWHLNQQSTCRWCCHIDGGFRRLRRIYHYGRCSSHERENRANRHTHRIGTQCHCGSRCNRSNYNTAQPLQHCAIQFPFPHAKPSGCIYPAFSILAPISGVSCDDAVRVCPHRHCSK